MARKLTDFIVNGVLLCLAVCLVMIVLGELCKMGPIGTIIVLVVGVTIIRGLRSEDPK